MHHDNGGGYGRQITTRLPGEQTVLRHLCIKYNTIEDIRTVIRSAFTKSDLIYFICVIAMRRHFVCNQF